MRIQELGHVVVKVRDAQRAENFYGKTLGIPIAARIHHPLPMVFFTLGRHHDFAVMELGKNGRSPDRNTAGLAHVAFKVGDSLEEFDATKSELEAAGVVILFELRHANTKGMHLHDPDGNEVELFVDIAPGEQPNADPGASSSESAVQAHDHGASGPGEDQRAVRILQD